MLKYKKRNVDFIIEAIGLQIKECEREYYRTPNRRKVRESGEPIDTEKMNDLLFERWEALEQCLEIVEQSAGLPYSPKVCIKSYNEEEE